MLLILSTKSRIIILLDISVFIEVGDTNWIIILLKCADEFEKKMAMMGDLQFSSLSVQVI